MSRCDRFGKLLPPKKLLIGDSVKLLKGAFSNFVATVETIDSNKRIWLMMELLGRPTRIQIEREQIKKML